MNADFRTFVRWRRNFREDEYLSHENRDDLDTYSAGVSRTFKYLDVGFEVSTNSDDDHSASLTLSTGIGYDPRTQSGQVEGHRYRDTGAVSARVYLDKNQGRYL